jgi:hypothetical protein
MPDHTTFSVGPEEVAGELIWQAGFDQPDQFRVESQGGTWEFAGGKLHIDCVDKRGVTIWLTRDVPTDLIVDYAGTCYPPSTGRNFNLFFCARGRDGRSMAEETELTGKYQLYHELPNYIFTLTCGHTRMRRDPGFLEQSELMLGSVDDHRYEIQVLKRGPRLQAVIDGRLIHDWTDPDPHPAGWVGLRTWNTKITYDHWAIYMPA